MNDASFEDADAGLILAAEECPPERFSDLHAFSPYDDAIIRKLTAHGPVLIRGGRGTGKSALLLEAHRRMRAASGIFSVYMSLRYLPLLQCDGDEYISHFCRLLSQEILAQVAAQGFRVEFSIADDIVSLQLSLSKLSKDLGRRLVILFDDAAHIGREKPLEVFFDLFRTLSTNTTSCKATIYPGVTRFGIRFDVFNDSTVIDISRSDSASQGGYFLDVIRTRYPFLALDSSFSDRLTASEFAKLLGRAVVGNMRAFILACNRFNPSDKVSIPILNSCLLNMATDYYWPLMEEVAPKLGTYEPLIEPTTKTFELIVEHVCKPLKGGSKATAQDRVIIHRSLVAQYIKIFEILEYLGFVAKREASRGMKSGGRGPVFAINLCSLLDQIPTKRLTTEMIIDWIEVKTEHSEIHVSGSTLSSVTLPELQAGTGIGILDKPVDVLAKSRAYPYGLTPDKINRLRHAGVIIVLDLARKSDEDLLGIDGIGDATVRRIKNVLQQAIWM